MSKKDDELAYKLVESVIIATILSPILLLKVILNLMQTIKELSEKLSKNSHFYDIEISLDEEEQLNKIDNMTGVEFEEFVAGLLIKNNYKKVKMTKVSGDKGADIISEKDTIKYAIQCKRFNSKVGARPIGEVLRGIHNYNCNKGIVITNNYFTNQAYEEADKCQVELWDRNQIIKLYRKAIKNSIEYRDISDGKREEERKRQKEKQKITIAKGVNISKKIAKWILAIFFWSGGIVYIFETGTSWIYLFLAILFLILGCISCPKITEYTHNNPKFKIYTKYKKILVIIIVVIFGSLGCVVPINKKENNATNNSIIKNVVTFTEEMNEQSQPDNNLLIQYE